MDTPLGKAETQHLEFKSAASLGDKSAIAREVVGMLNADGGDVWIGIHEKDSVAVSIEGIADADVERRSLVDHLVDTIEPAPGPGDIQVDIAPIEAGTDLLRVQVRRGGGGNGPYAFLKQGGRYFVTRSDARNRVMTLDEINERIRSNVRRGAGPFQEEAVGKARENLRQEREKALAERNAFWIRTEPAPPLTVDTHHPDLRRLLLEPEATGNRGSGWNFVNYAPPRPALGRLVSGDDDSEEVAIYETAAVEFRAPLQRLYWKGDPNEIWPYALLELTISVLRLTAHVLRRASPEQTTGSVLADLAIHGLRGWRLRPFSPMSIRFRLGPPAEFTNSDVLVSPAALHFSRQEVVEEPDHCGFRLIRRVYEGFGLFEEQIPSEYDRKLRRLIIPT